MFESLTERLNRTFRTLTGKGRLKEEHIKHNLREVRKNLLGTTLSPAQFFIKIVQDELIKIMGEENKTLDLNITPPAVLLMVGLQGSGKTTMVAKLGKWLKETQKKSVMVVSSDIYRPAAIEQLKTLADTCGITFHES